MTFHYESAAKQALTNFRSRELRSGSGGLRHHLFEGPTVQPGKMEKDDKAVSFVFLPNKDGSALTRLDILAYGQQTGAYEGIVTSWADFKDICDSKFKRVGGTSSFPAVADFGESDKEIVTDSWETTGAHIDLLLQASKTGDSPRMYVAILRITEASVLKSLAK